MEMPRLSRGICMNSLFTLEINRTVNQGCSLEFMSVIITFFCKVFDKVYVFSIANFNGTSGFPTELMKMFVRKVGVKFYFMKMVAFIF